MLLGAVNAAPLVTTTGKFSFMKFQAFREFLNFIFSSFQNLSFPNVYFFVYQILCESTFQQNIFSLKIAYDRARCN